MPRVIWNIIKYRKGWVPAIKFDYLRYKSLIQTCPKSTVFHDGEDPHVDFQYEGPIDGSYGNYNPVTKTITIDALEIFVVTADRYDMDNLKEFMERYDANLTQVLAHEGGHWHLDKRLGKLATMEKWVIKFIICALAALSILIPVIMVILLSMLVTKQLAVWTGPLLATAVHYCIISVMVWYAAKPINWIVTLSKETILIMTHRFCYHESFAREFEQCVHTNPDWEQVVTIEVETE